MLKTLCRTSSTHLSRRVSYNAKAFIPNPNGPNVHLIRRLMEEMEVEGQQEPVGVYKARALQRAVRVLDIHPEAITSGREALKIVGVGEGIARRIDEYLQPGPDTSPNRPKSRQMTADEAEREEALSKFKRVPGIGDVRARKLFDAGCRSLADLRKPEQFSKLSSPSKVALDYVDHLNNRVSRDQVEAVTKAVKSLVSTEIRMHVVGSYRRGLPSCADIDVLLFHPSCIYVPRPGEKSSVDLSSSLPAFPRRGRPAKHVSASRAKQDTLLRKFVLSPLERAGVLAATLSEGPRKWQGIVRIPDSAGGHERVEGGQGRSCVFRRMDLTLFPTLSEGAALLATTGDTAFNVYLRGVAIKRGLHLNEFGLWRFCGTVPAPSNEPAADVMQSLGSNTGSDGAVRNVEYGRWELVASTTEQEVLEELEIGYVEPERRNFAFVISRSGEGSTIKSPGRAMRSSQSRTKKDTATGN